MCVCARACAWYAPCARRAHHVRVVRYHTRTHTHAHTLHTQKHIYMYIVPVVGGLSHLPSSPARRIVRTNGPSRKDGATLTESKIGSGEIRIAKWSILCAKCARRR